MYVSFYIFRCKILKYKLANQLIKQLCQNGNFLTLNSIGLRLSVSDCVIYYCLLKTLNLILYYYFSFYKDRQLKAFRPSRQMSRTKPPGLIITTTQSWSISFRLSRRRYPRPATRTFCSANPIRWHQTTNSKHPATVGLL